MWWNWYEIENLCGGFDSVTVVQRLKKFVRVFVRAARGRVEMNGVSFFGELAMNPWLCDDDVLYL
jgi:hypothetical protein